MRVRNTPPRICHGSGAGLARFFRWAATRHPRRQFGMWRTMTRLARMFPSCRYPYLEGPDGLPFLVDAGDSASGNYVIGGWGEEEVQAVMEGLPDDSVAVDVGAHWGVWSRFFCHRFRNGHVWAFEPCRDSFDVLARNCSAHENVTCVCSAVGRETGEVTMSDWSVGSNYRRIVHSGASAGNVVPSVSFVEWIRSSCSSRLDLIKVDVEGYEVDVLCPAITYLSELRTRVVFEYVPELARQSRPNGAIEVFETLHRAGYRTFRLDRAGRWRPGAWMSSANWTDNYMALSPSDPLLAKT
jgi:FkbM family methyltransferase